MKIGIIGGGGFVGSGVCAAFASHGMAPVVIGRDNYASFSGESFDLLINANGNSRKYLAERDPRLEFMASVASVQASLVDFRAGLYVYLSTVDVYPDRANPANNREDAPIQTGALSLYGFHKHLAEEIVRRYAARWLVLRCGGFVGNGLQKNSIYDILHGQPLRVHADSAYQYLPTTALGEIIVRLAVGTAPSNEVFNVCGRGCLSLREAMALVPEYLLRYDGGSEPPREHYEVNLTKISEYLTVPQTTVSVKEFIRQWRNKERPG